MKVWKIILYVILGAAFATSLYFSYLYIQKNKVSTTLPPEIAARVNAERVPFFGKIKSVSQDKIVVSQYEDKGDQEIKIDDQTRYIITPFGKNEHKDGKIDDVKEGADVNISAIKNTDGSSVAETIEVIIQENE